MDYITNNLLLGGFVLVVALAVLTIYQRMYSNGYWTREYDPLFFDLDDPADEYEYRCVVEQRKSGRERGGPVYFTKKVEDSKNDN